MLKKFIKTLANSGLFIILLGMLIFPILSMGIIKYEDKSTVLSAEDERQGEQVEEIEITNENIPDEVEEAIMNMEREYYQSTESSGIED
ncbi:hypothetical protein GYA37_00375 [candidate division WWE3 bacterium]|uniref:Uncharacterized protein n=1 Tax=candidate division WWE3 bacterium TaxID=2053526 RepID=A0A7X9E6A6_UNCKA|nr:hypothetical protein [candidate division WWE3 bacterium]